MMNIHSDETRVGLDAEDATSLLAFRGDPYLVLSLYMDADSRQQELSGVRSRSHSLLHQAREQLTRRWDQEPGARASGRDAKGEHGVREAALDDLERCRAFLDAFLPGGACRGLALFSCAGRDWWQAYHLPRSVPDRCVWDAHPLVLPTLRLLPHYPQNGVAGTAERSGAPGAALEASRKHERQQALLQQLFDA
jgi:hypothetical protein